METRFVEFVGEDGCCLPGYPKFQKDDRKHLPKALGDEAVANGWARDVETGECGERVPGAKAAIIPANTTSTSG